MMQEGRFEGLTREQAQELFGQMEKGYREYGLDLKNRSNPQWHLPYLWRGETIEEQLADKANFAAQGTMRGSEWIPMMVLLDRYVCIECGANLETFEASFKGGTTWSLLCQREEWHSGIERALIYEAKEREAKSAKAMREAEHVPAKQLFDEIFGEEGEDD